MARRIPGARLITFPAAGHVPLEDIPQESVTEAEAFLREGGHIGGGAMGLMRR
jgi:pimeloyl-ACP methyl ester carboxylesterase